MLVVRRFKLKIRYCGTERTLRDSTPRVQYLRPMLNASPFAAAGTRSTACPSATTRSTRASHSRAFGKKGARSSTAQEHGGVWTLDGAAGSCCAAGACASAVLLRLNGTCLGLVSVELGARGAACSSGECHLCPQHASAASLPAARKFSAARLSRFRALSFSHTTSLLE